MTPQELISLLTSQHRTLQADLGLAVKNLDSEMEGKEAIVVENLQKFKGDLLAHVKLEGEEFYPDYLNKKAKRGEEVETTKKFIEEMDRIAKVVMEFLDKYALAENIEKASDDFRRELTQIVGVLNTRIETEEEGILDIYLAM